MQYHFSADRLSAVLYHHCIVQRLNARIDGEGPVYPQKYQFFGYQEIFKDMRIWTGYRNTLFYTVFGTLVNMLFTLPAPYVLSRKEFRARRLIMFVFVITMFSTAG